MRRGERDVLMRHLLMIVLAGLTVCAALDAAAARHRHRRHAAVHAPRQFVFATPEAAARAGDVGEFAGDFLTGIPAATTADPYQHPAYGYNQRGVYGPGYLYPGY